MGGGRGEAKAMPRQGIREGQTDEGKKDQSFRSKQVMKPIT